MIGVVPPVPPGPVEELLDPPGVNLKLLARTRAARIGGDQLKVVGDAWGQRATGAETPCAMIAPPG